MDIMPCHGDLESKYIESLDKWGHELYAGFLANSDFKPLEGEEFKKNRVRKDLLTFGLDPTAVEYCVELYPWLLGRGCIATSGLATTLQVRVQTVVTPPGAGRSRGGIQIAIQPVDETLPSISVITAIYLHEPWSDELVARGWEEIRTDIIGYEGVSLRPIGSEYSAETIEGHKDALLSLIEDYDVYHVGRAGTKPSPYQAVSGIAKIDGTCGFVSVRMSYDSTKVEIFTANPDKGNIYPLE